MPTIKSALYHGPITVASTETIRAIAFADTYSDGGDASATFVIALPTVATPAFSSPSGNYPAPQKVAISDATPGAAIYYTTDGTTPTTKSNPYSAPITVASNETLQAFAIATGYNASAVASAVYTIGQPPAAIPAFSIPGGNYATAQTVVLTDTTPGATIYFTIDGSTPTTKSNRYTSAIKVASTETVQAIAVATGYSASTVAAATYTIGPFAATPALSVATGTYSSIQSVAITDATPGAAIYYTTDGSTPTNKSRQYSVPIQVSSSETIRAIAYFSNYNPSPVASATYTINLISACHVDYMTNGNWPNSDGTTSFNAGIAITNTGTAPIAGWTLTWMFNYGQKVTSSWSDGSAVQTGTLVTITNAPFNASIAPGAKVNFGIVASYSGTTNAIPAWFAVNGMTCQ